MDFGLTPDQQALRARVIAFARETLAHDVVAADAEGAFSRDRWRQLAASGVLGLSIPPAFGGAGADAVTVACALEALGYGCRDLGLAFAASAHITSTQAALVEFGSPAQQARYLPAVARGEAIGAYCITEPDSGSDAFALKTTARKVDGGYVLNGQKMLVTFGPVCDFALVFATADPALGKWGVSLFLVDRGTPGFDTGAVEHKMGLRTVPIGRLTLTDCFVHDAQRVGREGAGAAIFSASQDWERALILAWQVGAMEAQLERAIAYARDRKAFGQPIGKFQSVANRLVEMKRRLETSRLLTYKAAWLKAAGKPMALEASLVHLHVGETFIESSLDAVAVHGGRGYLTAFEVERDLRDAVGGAIYGGTSDIQRTIVARLLGL